MTLYVTGFGAFASHSENPSEWLAKNCGEPHTILPVTFQAVEDFLASGTIDQYDAWLLLGVSGTAEKLHLETRAQNHIGPHPDVSGSIQGPSPIDPKAPQNLAATLWNTTKTPSNTPLFHYSVDAGDYLCNYSLFRALQTYPGSKIGFLHVPTPDKMNLQTQLAELKALIDELKDD